MSRRPRSHPTTTGAEPAPGRVHAGQALVQAMVAAFESELTRLDRLDHGGIGVDLPGRPAVQSCDCADDDRRDEPNDDRGESPSPEPAQQGGERSKDPWGRTRLYE